MEIIKALLTRIRRTGVLFIIGVILIIYIYLGFVYWQQDAKQTELTEQTAKLTAVLVKPLPSIEKLQAEQEAAKQALAPMTDIKAIAILVSIAEKSGIDTDNNTGKFRVPSVTFGSTTVGGGNYPLMSFNGISVSGNYTDVMAFIADLHSGETLGPDGRDIVMVLTMVKLNKVGDGEWAETETQASVNVDIYTKP